MKNKITFLILFIVLGFSIPKAQVHRAWVAFHNGPGNNSDGASSLALDGSGNIYVTGGSYGIGTGSDYITIKYNSSAIPLWIKRYNGPGNSDDNASSLSVDGFGNVYVTGQSRGIGSGSDYATIKYNSSGDLLWVARYNGSGTSYDNATSLAVDGLGNVYVTGGSNSDYATIKYNSSGVQQWIQTYNSPGNGVDGAISLAIDGSGNVCITGGSYGIGTRIDYATIKYNSAGDLLWVVRYNGAGKGDDAVQSLAVDSSGNVYITGYSLQIGGYDIATIKYNSSGVEQWARIHNAYNGWDFGTSVAVDGSGNVYVTGGTSSDFSDFNTIKYNTYGEEQWTQRYNGTGENEWAVSLTLDGSGNVYVTGNSQSGQNDCVTIKYNSSGVQQWIQIYREPYSSSHHPSSIGVDGSGNVYVTGSSGDGSGADLATIKYSQTEGITAPSNLSAQSIGSSFINVRWQDNSNDEDGFYIERTKINSSHWEVIDAVPQNANHYSDLFVTRGLKYYYRVKAYSGNTFSEYSNIDSAILGGNPLLIPAPPSNLVLVKRTANAITMDWQDNSDNENGFIIFSKSEGDLFFEIADSVGTDVVTYQEVGVSPDLDHYYKICSYNASGISDYSNTLIVSGESAPDINSSKLTRNYILSGNYPNPFNPVTVIRYSLIENRFITLKVYDILGNEVATLVNEKQNAGSYEVDFDGSDFSSGVYFYKLVVDGNIIDTKRMVLLK